MVKRSVIVLLSLTLVGVLIGAGRIAAETAPAPDDHPVMGSWALETDPGDMEFSPRLATLSADGTALFVSGEKVTGVGSWEPSGDASANLTFRVVTNGPAFIVIRASVDVTPDGQLLTGTFTNEFVFDPAGGGTGGEIGPGTLTGTRIVAEAPGTPVMTFEEMFAPPDASPEATPES